VLKQHKSERQKGWAAKKNAPSSLTKSSSKKPEKSLLAQAGHMLVVEIGNFSDVSSSYEVLAAAATGTAATALFSRISENHLDFNLDSGCLVSMMPFISDVEYLSLDKTPV
jgi:hypothetical protein